MAMDAEQAKAFFQRADDLYNAGEFSDALRILAELNKAFPNQKNVIWPSALCLGKLGRHEEAIRACDILVAQHGDSRAADLRERLAAHRHGAVAPPPIPRADMLDGPIGLDAIDAMLDRPDPVKRELPTAGPDYKKLGLIAAGALVILFLVAVPLLGRGVRSGEAVPGPDLRGTEQTQEEREAAEAYERGVVAGREAVETVLGSSGDGAEATSVQQLSFVVYIAMFFAYALSMYCTFSILGKLPFSEFSDNVADILLYAIIFSALGFIPIVGFVATLVIMSKHYQLSCGELLISNIVIVVLTLGFIAVGAIVFGLTFAGAMATAT